MSGHTSNSFQKTATCCSCKKQFEVVFYSSDGKVVDSVSPEICPHCGHNGFTTRFDVAPNSKWVGSYGSNG